MSARLISDLKIFVNETHVFQLLQNQPLALLGQATYFLVCQFLKKIFDCLGDPDCDDFSFLIHVLIINGCRQMSKYLFVLFLVKCIHMIYNALWY